LDTSRVDAEFSELLAQITGQKLRQQDLNPLGIFMPALISVLLGVIVINRAVAIEEKQHLQKVLNLFIAPDSELRPFVQRLLQGIYQQQVYLQPNELHLLVSPLSISERLLLICFGYDMAGVTGTMGVSKEMYLRSLSHRFAIDPRYTAVLAASFSHQEIVDKYTFKQVYTLLKSADLQKLDAAFMKATETILSTLATRLK
jgi:hypothetical protein